jgi:hypothetical protein
VGRFFCSAGADEAVDSGGHEVTRGTGAGTSAPIVRSVLKATLQLAARFGGVPRSAAAAENGRCMCSTHATSRKE